MSSILDKKPEQTVDPVVSLEGLVRTATPRQEEMQQVVEQSTAPFQGRSFTPETLGEASQIQGGTFMDTAKESFGQTLLGFDWYDNLGEADRERMTTSAANYADQHGVKAFFATMGGGMLGDAPTDIALALTGVGALSAMNKMIKAGKTFKGLTKARDALQKVENAYTGVGGTVGSRFATRQLTEFATGATAAAINDQIIRTQSDRLVTADDTLDRMIMEGVGGMIFGEALRAVGKSAGALKNKINESLPEGSKLKRQDHIEQLISKEEKELADLARQPLEADEARLDVDADEVVPPEGPVQEFIPDDPDQPTFFIRNEVGDLEANPDFVGTTADAVKEITTRPEFANIPGVRVAKELLERMEEMTADVPGRTQIDEMLDVIVRQMDEVDIKNSPLARGVAFSGRGREGFNYVRQLINDGDHASFVRILGGLEPDVAAKVIAHEFTHIASVLEINAKLGEVATKLGKDIVGVQNARDPNVMRSFLDEAGVDRQDPLYRLNEAFAASVDQAFDESYGFTNIKEFLAEALTNSSFQKKLNRVTVEDAEGATSTLWERIVDALADLIGLKDKSALAEVIEAQEGLLDSILKKGVVDPEGKKGSLGLDRAGAKPGELLPPRQRALTGPAASDAPQKAAQRIEDNNKKITQLAESKGEGLKTGTGSVEQHESKVLRWLRSAANSVITTDNLNLYNMFDMMGGTGKFLKKTLLDGDELTSKLQNRMQPHIDNAREMIDKRKKALEKESDVELTIATEFKKAGKGKGQSGQTGIKGEPQKIKLTGFQRLELYMKAMDGLKKSERDIDKGYNHSSMKDLYKKNGGFVVDDVQYVLTKDQVKAIQDNPSILVSPEEIAIAETIWNGYRSMVKDANKVSKRLVGENIMDADNWYYSPKNLIGADGKESDMYDFIRAKLTRDKKSSTALSASLKAREQTGGFSHDLINPLDRMESYQFTVSESLGFADFNIQMDHLMKTKGLAIKKAYGQTWHKTLDKFRKAMTGSNEDVGSAKEFIFLHKMLSLRAQAILGYNPSVAAKQVGSAWSSTMTRYYQENGNPVRDGAKLTKEASKMANIGGRDTKWKQQRLDLIEEMRQHSEFFRHRQDSGDMNIELADIRQFLREGATSKAIRKKMEESGLIDFVKDKGNKLNEKRIEKLGKSMDWIRRFDEATMAAIWDDIKLKEFGEDGPQSDADWKRLSEIFHEVAVESQPTYSKGSRTFNQMRKTLAARGLNQFTTQTAKNWGLAYNAVMDHYTKYPPTKGRPLAQVAQENKILLKRLTPLLIQNAYIAAVTTAMAAGTGAIIELVGGDEGRKTRMDKAFPNLANRYFAEYVNGLTGQVAGIGAFTKAISSGAMGAPIYDIQLPVIQEAIDGIEGLTDLDPRKITKTLMTLRGIPLTPFRMTGQL